LATKWSFLPQAAATASLWLALLLPLLAWALWTSRLRPDRRLLQFAALVYLDLVCVMVPRSAVFQRLDWNWQGKILEVLWVVVLAAVPGYGLGRLGIRGRSAPRSLLPMMLATAVGTGYGMLLWSKGMRMPADRETLLFELTMPGIAEELVFRGVFQSLLNEVFHWPWKVRATRFGWGGLLTLALFVIGHGFIFDRRLHLQTSLFGAAFALIPGALLGWLRERTESVWPCILVHNVIDGVPLIASAASRMTRFIDLAPALHFGSDPKRSTLPSGSCTCISSAQG